MMYVLLLAKQSITTKEPDLEFSHTFPLHNQDTRWMQDSLLLSIFKFCLQTSLSNWQSRNSPITYLSSNLRVRLIPDWSGDRSFRFGIAIKREVVFWFFFHTVLLSGRKEGITVAICAGFQNVKMSK